VFSGAGDWASVIGGLAADVATHPGYMYLNCSTGNQCVGINNKVTAGADNIYLFKMRIKVISGDGTLVEIGAFPSATNNTYSAQLTITNTDFKWFYGLFYGFPSAWFYIGVLTANNNNTDFLIDEVHLDKVTLADLYDLDISEYTYKNTGTVFQSLSKSAQSLLQLNVVGDSILANDLYATTSPSDEGAAMRPPRMETNNVVRRIYDDRKYNVPIYRRLDHADWTKSTLSGDNDFPAFFSGEGFISNNPSESYFLSVTQNSYCEIIIPDGYENFAILYCKKYQTATVNHDSDIAVTINGGDISAYGDAIINSYVGLGVLQNGHALAVYSSLPVGDNTIRLTKSNDVEVFSIWGCMYWTGNTMKLNQFAIGGLATNFMSTYTSSWIKTENLYNWIFQLSGINDCGQSITAVARAYALMNLFLNNEVDLENMLFISTHPFGTDPSDGSPNYYTTYDEPLTIKQGYTLYTCLLTWVGAYFVDLFRLFERDITTVRGGTLEGGESGGYYTLDGQHLDEDGVKIFYNYLIADLPQIPD
jgi:hypothetical protein